MKKVFYNDQLVKSKLLVESKNVHLVTLYKEDLVRVTSL